jgi:alpha-ribazole phosphatase
MLEVYLIRHTSVGVSKAVCYGKSDVELSENFLYEKTDVYEKLYKAGAFSHNAPILLYSSPLKRCALLAEYIQSQGKIKTTITLDKRVQEMDFGDWEMQKWDVLPIDSFQSWMTAFTSTTVPNGEKFMDMYDRTTDFMKELVLKHENPDTLQPQVIFIFAHAGSIRTIISHCLGMPPENTFRFGMEYGAVSRLRYIDKYWRVDFVNR